jgi:hypothetical protein
VTANGVENYGQILGHFNEQISKGLKIPDFCTDALDSPQCESAKFSAPTSVTLPLMVFWDGNTGRLLTKVGLAIVPPNK